MLYCASTPPAPTRNVHFVLVREAGCFVLLHDILTMRNKMKKQPNNKKMIEVRVVPQGMDPLANGEAARCGVASLAQNVRELEQSLQVTGAPAVTGAIAVDDRMLLMTDGHTVTCRGQTVKIDGATVVTVTSAVIAAHVVGDLIVVVCQDGLTYLACREGAWMALDPAAAAPSLTIGTTMATSSVQLDVYSFAERYSQWRAPLAEADRAALTAQLRSAWSRLSSDIHAEGRYLSPLLVRWAVRLHDGHYLWMSDPVRVGDATMSNVNRISAAVTMTDDGFTGIESSTLALAHYRLEIDVARNIAAEWLPLVSSIDVFVTDEPQLLTASRALDYRCVARTSSPRAYYLEMGLTHRSADAIARELATSAWHLVARCPAAPVVTGADFVNPDAPMTLSNAQCNEIGRLLSMTGVVCSTTAAGRLYCCTRDGDVVSSAAGNALAEAYRRRVLGASPLALAVVTRPLYSSGFGRYPVYVFTDDGIYAIPQGATGALGEARLVDRTVIAAGVNPVEGGGDVWLMSRHGHLCRLNGSRLTVTHRDMDCTSLAWSDAQRELWMLPTAGYPVVMMPSGRLSVRTVEARQLYSDPRHAVAVTDAGTVLDLEQETPTRLPVLWRSHPVLLDPLMADRVCRVVWHMRAQDVNLTLRVVGQRGIMDQERDVSIVTVDGAVKQPLATAPMLAPVRTVCLSVDGVATSGALMMSTLLYCGKGWKSR